MEKSGSAEPQLGPNTQTKAELGLGDPRGVSSTEPQLGPNSQIKAEPELGDPGTEPATWRSRGYLPHFDCREKIQSITFRLADSLPQVKLEQLQQELKSLPEEKQQLERRKQIEAWLDSGMGCCALHHPAVANVVRETLLRFDEERYSLLAWCIMPNHVHVLIKPNKSLGKIVQSWKSYTGRWALEKNAELGLGVPGKTFWMREYWDRYIRDETHYKATVEYIHNNPVKAGLCARPKDWQWSSASEGWQ